MLEYLSLPVFYWAVIKENTHSREAEAIRSLLCGGTWIDDNRAMRYADGREPLPAPILKTLISTPKEELCRRMASVGLRDAEAGAVRMENLLKRYDLHLRADERGILFRLRSPDADVHEFLAELFLLSVLCPVHALQELTEREIAEARMTEPPYADQLREKYADLPMELFDQTAFRLRPLNAAECADEAFFYKLCDYLHALDTPQIVNLDAADVRTVIPEGDQSGLLLELSGDMAWMEKMLENRPELADTMRLLIDLKIPENAGLDEVNTITDLLADCCHTDCSVLWGVGMSDKPFYTVRCLACK